MYIANYINQKSYATLEGANLSNMWNDVSIFDNRINLSVLFALSDNFPDSVDGSSNSGSSSANSSSDSGSDSESDLDFMKIKSAHESKPLKWDKGTVNLWDKGAIDSMRLTDQLRAADLAKRFPPTYPKQFPVLSEELAANLPTKEANSPEVANLPTKEASSSLQEPANLATKQSNITKQVTDSPKTERYNIGEKGVSSETENMNLLFMNEQLNKGHQEQKCFSGGSLSNNKMYFNGEEAEVVDRQNITAYAEDITHSVITANRGKANLHAEDFSNNVQVRDVQAVYQVNMQGDNSTCYIRTNNLLDIKVDKKDGMIQFTADGQMYGETPDPNAATKREIESIETKEAFVGVDKQKQVEDSNKINKENSLQEAINKNKCRDEDEQIDEHNIVKSRWPGDKQ